jgi:hypothetical protein
VCSPSLSTEPCSRIRHRAQNRQSTHRPYPPLTWGGELLACHRPSGSYSKTGVMSGLATIHPEPILENQSKEIIEFDVFLLD